jgi:hypothetical protein
MGALLSPGIAHFASSSKSRARARDPAGQIAARELEITRLRTALARADEFTQAAGDALEAAAM